MSQQHESHGRHHRRSGWSPLERIAVGIALLLVIAIVAGGVWIVNRLGVPESNGSRGKDSMIDFGDGPVKVGDIPIGPNGATFTPLPEHPDVAPLIEIIDFSSIKEVSAIWGATGRDHRGHIWMGISKHGYGGAHLVELHPFSGKVIDHGDVLSQMRRLAPTVGASQIKIHSRIEQAADGKLYFASMDEAGESPDGRANPKWGSHLWRISPDSPDQWEHLAAEPVGMIALACGRRYVYTLGYYGHVLYQFDIESERIRSVRVGSSGGHISRNFIVDQRDHAYVPRMTKLVSGELKTKLIEYDSSLRELRATPLEAYGDESSHGIVGVQPMADGSIVFITGLGMLYRLQPPTHAAAGTPAEVIKLGFMHPEGERYIASLFTYDGRTQVMGVGIHRDVIEWIVFDLSTRQAKAYPMTLQYPDERITYKLLLYGSITRDNEGAFYVVGTDQKIDRPVALRLIPPR